MANLKEVKNRIKSVTSTQQITKAMKMVAAAKLRRSQERILQMRPYTEKLGFILNNVTASLENESSSPYAEVREVKNVLLVAVTSDRGLCGGFNSSIIKSILKTVKEKYSDQYAAGNLHIMTIGKKSYDYFRKRPYNVNGDFSDLFTRLTFENVRKAAETAMDGFVSGKYDVVEIVFNEFKNVATQIVVNKQLLPLAQTEKSGAVVANNNYIFEPSKESIINELIPKSVKIQFYSAVLESNASEHGARMSAMDKATENAGELLKELKLTYNRTRQAAITKEILEIVGGAEALSSGN